MGGKVSRGRPKKEYSAEVAWFKKPSVIFWIAVITMFIQGFVSTQTILSILHLSKTWYYYTVAAISAIVLEMFIIIYVIRGNKLMSKWFCAVSIVFNLTHLLFPKLNTVQWYLIPAIICYCIVVPLAVYKVSDELNK